MKIIAKRFSIGLKFGDHVREYSTTMALSSSQFLVDTG